MQFKKTLALAVLSVAAVGGAHAAEPTLADIIGSGFTLISDKTSFSLADFGPEALFKAEYTSGAASQTFGFFSGAQSKEIFDGADTAGEVFALSAASIAPVDASSFGVYFTSGARYDLGNTRIQTWYNETSHVWAFGFEDGTDNDYQDMVITMAPVPEPSTYALMAGGLLAMGALVRRRNRQA